MLSTALKDNPTPTFLHGVIENLPIHLLGDPDIAKTVGFTIPYAIYYAQAVVGKDSGIETFEDMKGKRVAAAVGTVPEIEFLKYAEKWDTKDLYQGYQSENEVFLAVAQGKVDAGLTTNTAVKLHGRWRWNPNTCCSTR
ncbi:MAG: putative ABC transporter extracellular-binding protein YckB [Gammaproteobacteria bacterium]|nr:putative ABC transporter extracellular-binding protein YckB [Gammaproteobacteria bacterium]